MFFRIASWIAVLFLGACHGDSPEAPSAPGRAYRMGFSATPPKLDPEVLVRALLLSTHRALSQLTFADLDLSTFPQPVPENLPLCVSLGWWTASSGPYEVLGGRWRLPTS